MFPVFIVLHCAVVDLFINSSIDTSNLYYVNIPTPKYHTLYMHVYRPQQFNYYIQVFKTLLVHFILYTARVYHNSTRLYL